MVLRSGLGQCEYILMEATEIWQLVTPGPLKQRSSVPPFPGVYDPENQLFHLFVPGWSLLGVNPLMTIQPVSSKMLGKQIPMK